jgi:hypothetical protein
VGSAYTAQAVSDWERDRSQIHKDHPTGPHRIGKVLHDLGGIKIIDEAKHLLASSNYRALGKEELSEIFGVTKLEYTKNIRKKYWEIQLTILRDWIKRLDLITISKSIAWILYWFAMYLGISPVLDFSIQTRTELVSAVVKLTLTCLVLPIVLTWCTPQEYKIPQGTAAPFTHFLLCVIGLFTRDAECVNASTDILQSLFISLVNTHHIRIRTLAHSTWLWEHKINFYTLSFIS